MGVASKDKDSQSRPGASLKLKLLLSAFSMTITVLAMEIFAQVFVTRIADDEQFSRFASLRQYQNRADKQADGYNDDQWWFGLLSPHRYLGFIPTPNFQDDQSSHNSFGFRGAEVTSPKPDDEFRIVCMGASTTYTIWVNDNQYTYPAQLETILNERGHENVTVINAGVLAWTSYETMINMLIRVVDLEPDLLILHHAFNDVASRIVWPPESYKGDNSGYLAPSFSYKPPPWFEQSTLIRMLLVQTGNTVPHTALGKSVFNEADSSKYMEFFKQRFGGKYPSGIFENVPVADMIEANPPIYFERNTESILLNAKSRNIPIVAMSFGYSAQVGTIFFDIEGFEEATIQHNQILQELAGKHDVPFADFASHIPPNLEYWAPDGIHVTEAGAKLKATFVADFLAKETLIP